MEALTPIHIKNNLEQLTKLTKNFPEVLERLRDYDVLTSSEIKHIECCSDEETSISMLYTIVAQKPLSNFDLLLYVLQDTDNDMLAKLLERSLKSGEKLNLPRQLSTQQLQHQPLHEDTDNTLIAGGEMGISELLEEYTEDWRKLYRSLNLPKSCLSSYNHDGNFLIQATLILRDWSALLKRRATVGNLCNILDEGGYHQCSARVRRMFDRYIDSGFAFDFPGSFPIKGKITVISSILDNNPSFCFHPERLLLMLNLPLESLSEFVHGAHSSFPKIAHKMLTRWSEEEETSSTDHLASLLAINGHFSTCAKISSL